MALGAVSGRADVSPAGGGQALGQAGQVSRRLQKCQSLAYVGSRQGGEREVPSGGTKVQGAHKNIPLGLSGPKD